MVGWSKIHKNTLMSHVNATFYKLSVLSQLKFTLFSIYLISSLNIMTSYTISYVCNLFCNYLLVTEAHNCFISYLVDMPSIKLHHDMNLFLFYLMQGKSSNEIRRCLGFSTKYMVGNPKGRVHNKTKNKT